MLSLQSLLQHLPQSDGWLPKWQLLVTGFAVFNALQNFVTLRLTRKLYNAVPASSVTPLQARTFATWTLTSAVVRFYAAYHINEKLVYDMALFTYLIAFSHFTSEVFIFRTANLRGGTLAPMSVAITSLIWMIKEYEFYVNA